MAKTLGIAAAGHPQTAAAASEILKAGGNAFDAVLAALCASCVAEPLLASLGGGGFLVAKPAGLSAEVYDFFVETPSHRRPADEIDFFPILADFGTATQEFHIGMGSIAVPGVIAGLFEIHRHRCRMPLREIIEPARSLAVDGLTVNSFQHLISTILSPIVKATPAAMRLVATDEQPGRFAGEGETVRNADLADALEMLVIEGPGLFYHGEMGQRLIRDCSDHGGLLQMGDLANYRVERRQPIEVDVTGGRLDSNSPPSPGGCLIALALALVQEHMDMLHGWGSPSHCMTMIRAMHAANLARREHEPEEGFDYVKAIDILRPESKLRYGLGLEQPPVVSRGTTHMSVADRDGNIASMTITNGEGSAYVLPGTGIMLNNMLGEEDLNPKGFHRWPAATRLASMMSPSVLTLSDGGQIAVGSGGSNRIRSALLQVLVNVLDFDMSLEAAVAAPRLHLEHDHLSIEDGYSQGSIDALAQEWPDIQLWPASNLFFGGVHAVRWHPDGHFEGAGDPRRGGAVSMASG